MSRNRIAELRQAAGLSAREVGQRVAMELGRAKPIVDRTVYRWETGDTGIPDECKLVLADIFGVSVTWLMGWEDNGSNGERTAA